MASQDAQRRLAAIMFADIVGYTALMGESEARGLRARERHRALFGRLAAEYGGEIDDENGDELVLSFTSALDAVHCGLAAQAELDAAADFRVRIGIHLGDVVFEGGRVYGDGVNVASRIRPFAASGGVCVSEPVHDSIKNQESVRAVSLGVQQLRNVARPVEVFRVTGTAAPPRPGVRASSRAGSRRPLWAATAVLALIAAALGALWLSRPTAAGPIQSIAVLPLESLSDDPEQEYFAAGMTDALISDLAKIETLRVISRTTVLRHKDTRLSLPEVARELEADAVVEGTVQRAGSRVRITAQLIDARNDVHLWSESYERDLSDILALQSEVAKAIARAIEHELTPRERRRLARDASVDPAAYEATLRGRQVLSSMTPSDHKLSVNYFKLAIEHDPDYAPAYAGLADAYT